MSDKSRSAELIQARVLREREWMHKLWMQRMNFHQIAAAAALSPEHGGLGIQVSPAGVKSMVHAYREDRGDVTMGRDERRERQSDELDELARALRQQIADVKAEHGTVDKDAVKLLLDIGKRESDLHGLAAPTQIQAEVVTRDAIIDELNAELIALGREPVSE